MKITGNDLIAAIVHHTAPLIDVRGEFGIEQIHPVEAIERVRRGDYEGFCRGNTGRLRYIKRIARPVPVWSRCWRTTQAAVLLPSIEWLHSRRSGVLDKPFQAMHGEEVDCRPVHDANC